MNVTSVAVPVRAAARSCYAKLGGWAAERPESIGLGMAGLGSCSDVGKRYVQENSRNIYVIQGSVGMKRDENFGTSDHELLDQPHVFPASLIERRLEKHDLKSHDQK